MPGAFAHITAVNEAIGNTNSLDSIAMPNQAKLALTRFFQYAELGCVSPDYPYLVIGDSQQNYWADLMHKVGSGDIVKLMATYCKQLSGNHQMKFFAWLSGYLSHVIADVTIHPVVKLKVGEYESNKADHRTCEMNQDAYIWQRLNIGTIGYSDRVRLNIGRCVDENGKFDPEISELWVSCLRDRHREYAEEVNPNIGDWHNGFQKVVDNAEEGYRRLFKWARHVSASLGLGVMYPNINELRMEYIENLETPRGKMHYDEIFDFAVDNIKKYISDLAAYVFTNEGALESIKNWDLDDGEDEHGKQTVWL
tara:strand:- start:1283 stop:2209 length:927 start_codon:yes stop_codon:yes gene_type:complete